jgi:hypothetical protein
MNSFRAPREIISLSREERSGSGSSSGEGKQFFLYCRLKERREGRKNFVPLPPSLWHVNHHVFRARRGSFNCDIKGERANILAPK